MVHQPTAGLRLTYAQREENDYPASLGVTFGYCFGLLVF